MCLGFLLVYKKKHLQPGLFQNANAAAAAFLFILMQLNLNLLG